MTADLAAAGVAGPEALEVIEALAAPAGKKREAVARLAAARAAAQLAARAALSFRQGAGAVKAGWPTQVPAHHQLALFVHPGFLACEELFPVFPFL